MAENNENIVPVDTNNNIPDKVLLVMNGENGLRVGNKTMRKVPQLLRQDKNNQHEYDPLVVSLGPYHHGKKELQPIERFKMASFNLLVGEMEITVGGQRDATAKLIYTKVLDVVNDLRDCYFDVSKNQYDDPYFAQMMLLDACFVIHYIVGATSLLELFGLDEFSSSFLDRDLLLLENQIPFWLIKKLILLGYGEDNGEAILKNWKINGQDEPTHLLHREWCILTQTKPTQECVNITPAYCPLSKLGKLSENCINLLKNVTRFPCQWRNPGDDEEKENSTDNSIYSFRSASEC